MNIPADIIERINRAADELFAAGGRETFPTVDQVRRAARTDMNAASAVMRDWRRAQTALAAPVVAQVPEAVTQANGLALATLWQAAQDLANESLRNAQAAWESERSELDAMRSELADAFEAQARELENAHRDAATAAQINQEVQQIAAKELAGVQMELVDVQARATRAEAAAEEIQHRADDLRGELTRAHQEGDQLRGQLATQQQTNQAVSTERDQARAEAIRLQAQVEASFIEINRLREERTQADQRREDTQQQLAEARERAAGLNGQLEAVQSQNAALLARLPAAESKPGKR